MLILLSACRAVPPLGPVNLKEPGWTIHEGQAVWKAKGRKEIAGEVLLATRSDGSCFVQFSKNPFPLLSAQRNGNLWEVELPTNKKRYWGKGEPPTRLIWLYLPRALSGQPPPKGWTWQTLNDNGWRLEKRSTGERIEGYFNQ